MDERLQSLFDKDRIIETINRLFIATDRRDWPAVEACFAPKVRFNMTSVTGGEPTTRTPREIAEGWEQGLKDLTAIHHQAGNYIVQIREAEADAFCYGIATHYLPNPSGANTRTFVGSYDFHLTRQADDWRIDRMTFHLKYLDGNPNLEGSR